MEHPQVNGQVEAANKVILEGLKKRLNEAKASWADELESVLWAYQTTLHSAIGETPFCLTYGMDIIFPIEIGELSPRVLLSSKISNDTNRIQDLDLLPKIREES